MDYIQSAILAIVQGITEFLPISSSGHLVLTPYIFGWDYRGLSFDVALHLGTVMAIMVFFWRDIIEIIRNAIPSTKSDIRTAKFPPNMLWQIIVATIPAAVVGILISDLVEKYLHTPVLIAINLAIFGIILWLSDRVPISKKLQATSYKLSFIVGIFQAIALMPGVSRSGITITGSRFLGMSRENAARFSFLLGIPAMLGAAALEATKIELSQIDTAFLLAMLVSAIVGFFAIKYLIEYLKRGKLALFAIYRIILAAVVLAVYFTQR